MNSEQGRIVARSILGQTGKLSASMEIQRLTKAHAEAIATWRYSGRYATYDVRETLTPSRGYWAVISETELVGYCCFGPEGRPPGIDEEEGTLDVGYGMRPDLVGRGLGAAFVAAILDFGLAEFTPNRLRLLILSWNERSRKVAEALGFEEKRMVSSAERDFRVMVRPAMVAKEYPPAPIARDRRPAPGHGANLAAGKGGCIHNVAEADHTEDRVGDGASPITTFRVVIALTPVLSERAGQCCIPGS